MKRLMTVLLFLLLCFCMVGCATVGGASPEGDGAVKTAAAAETSDPSMGLIIPMLSLTLGLLAILIAKS